MVYLYRGISKEKNIEWIKTSIFLEAVLSIETMKEPQSNLEKKESPIILKDDVFSRKDK